MINIRYYPGADVEPAGGTWDQKLAISFLNIFILSYCISLNIKFKLFI